MSPSLSHAEGRTDAARASRHVAVGQDRLRNRSARAEHGDAQAQFDLGLMYATGDGVGLDYVAAHQWLNLAALAGNDAARTMRAELAGDMTPAQIAEAQRRARVWLRRQAH